MVAWRRSPSGEGAEGGAAACCDAVAGEDRGSEAAGAGWWRSCPQESQNLAVGDDTPWQRGQMRSSGDPHSSQNLAAGRLSCPHFRHCMMSPGRSASVHVNFFPSAWLYIIAGIGGSDGKSVEYQKACDSSVKIKCGETRPPAPPDYRVYAKSSLCIARCLYRLFPW